MPEIRLLYGKKGLYPFIHFLQGYRGALQVQQDAVVNDAYMPQEEGTMLTAELLPHNLSEFRDLLLQVRSRFREAWQLLQEKELACHQAVVRSHTLLNTFNKLFFKKRYIGPGRLKALRHEVALYRRRLDTTALHLDIDTDRELDELYTALCASFRSLSDAEKKWDSTPAAMADEEDPFMDRLPATISENRLPFLKTGLPSLCFAAGGADELYLYPGFMVIYKTDGSLQVLGYTDMKVKVQEIRFIEQEDLPADAKVVETLWYKVRRDGSPDRDFPGNYEIPVALYPQVEFSFAPGFSKQYIFSSLSLAHQFCNALNRYMDGLQKASTP